MHTNLDNLRFFCPLVHITIAVSTPPNAQKCAKMLPL